MMTQWKGKVGCRAAVVRRMRWFIAVMTLVERACDVGKRARVDEGGRISGRVYLTKIREKVLKIKSVHCHAHCESDEFVLFLFSGIFAFGL